MVSKDLVLIIFGRIVVACVGLITIRLLTTYLTVEQYGQMALLTAVQSLCGLFLVGPVGQYITLNTHSWYDSGCLIHKLKIFTRYLLLVSILGGCVVFMIFHQDINAIVFGCVMSLLVFMHNLNNTLIPKLNMVGYRSESVKLNVLSVVSALLFSILFMLFYPAIESWIFGQVIGMALGVYAVIKFSNKEVLIGTDKKNHFVTNLNYVEIAKYCLPLSIATGCMWAGQNGYRFIIESFWGLEELGVFALGFQISSAIWAMVELIVVQFLFPYFYRRVTDCNDQSSLSSAYSDLMNSLLPVYIALAGVFIAGGPFFLKLLATSEFQLASKYFVFGILVECFRVICNVISTAAHIKKQTHKIIPTYAISAIIILLGGACIGSLGWQLSSLALVMVGASLSMLIIMFFSMNQLIKSSLDFHRIFLAVGVSLLFAYILPSSLPIEISYHDAIFSLFGLFFVAVLAIAGLLYRNSALTRLIQIKLVK